MTFLQEEVTNTATFSSILVDMLDAPNCRFIATTADRIAM